MITVATRSPARTRRSRSPSSTTASTPRLGIHPHNANEPDAHRLDELRELLAPRARRRRRRDGPRLLPRVRAARRAAAPVRGAARARRRARQAGRHPHPRRRRRHARRARCAPTARSSSTASRRPALLEPALERGWYVSFAGNVTYPKAPELREAARRVPHDRILAETDSPYLAPQPVRGKPNEPANVDAHARRRSPRRAARTRPSSPARSTPTPPPRSGCEGRAEEAARPALPRRREHPRRDRPPRRARRRRRRARGRPRPRHPHALPRRARRARPRRRARPLARAAPARTPGTTLHWQDALALDPAALEPAADEARREPAVQHRHAARRREPRPHAGDRLAGA